MRTLDRYILRSFLHSALLWFVVLMALRIVVDMFCNMDEFVKGGRPFGQLVQDIATYYSYHSLVYFTELGGIIIAASAAFTLAMMNHTNELTAMMASGVSLRRVAVPIILSSVVLGGLIVVDQEFVIPRVSENLVRDRDNLPGQDKFTIRMACDSGDTVWYAPVFHTMTGNMERPLLIVRESTPDKSLRASVRITGIAARPDVLDGCKGWQIDGAQLLKMSRESVPWQHPPEARRVFCNLGPQQMLENARDEKGNKVDISHIKDVNLGVRQDLQNEDLGMRLTIRGRLFPDNPVSDGTVLGGRLENARFTFKNADGQEIGTFHAPQARWQGGISGQTYWDLTKGEFFYPSDLTARDLALRQSGHWLDYLSIRQLTDLLKLKRVTNKEDALLVRHTRVAEPINALVILLLALPFILSRERNIKASAGLALLISGSFYAFVYMSRYMGLPPEWAAWLPILLFGPIAVVMFDAIKT